MPSRRKILGALLVARGGALCAAPASGAPAGPTKPAATSLRGVDSGTPSVAANLAAPLAFPADFGAHLDTRTEWWYVTGALAAGDRMWGFQITFFRAATGVAGDEAGRFAVRQLLFAHGAVTDVAARRLRHDQRIARSGFGIAEASVADTGLVLRDWRLKRSGGAGASRYAAHASSDSAGFAFDLELAATQPLLLQGEDGVSRKGPRREQIQPLLQRAAARRSRHARPRRPTGRGRRPSLARPRMERCLHGSGRGRLGLDRHEP